MMSISRSSDQSNLIDSILKEASINKKAMEFPTQEAMDKYLKEHPDADRSNHKVVETKKEEAKPEVSTEELKGKIEEKKEELKKPTDIDQPLHKQLDKETIQSLSWEKVYDLEKDDDGISWTAHNKNYPDEDMSITLGSDGSLS